MPSACTPACTSLCRYVSHAFSYLISLVLLLVMIMIGPSAVPGLCRIYSKEVNYLPPPYDPLMPFSSHWNTNTSAVYECFDRFAVDLSLIFVSSRTATRFALECAFHGMTIGRLLEEVRPAVLLASYLLPTDSLLTHY